MANLHEYNLTQKLIEVFFYDNDAYFSTTEGMEIDIQDLCHMALRFGSNKIFRHALAMGAHPDIKDSEGNSALCNLVYGVLGGYRCPTANLAKMFKTLVKDHYCDPREEAEDIMHIAASKGLDDIIVFLIDDLKFNVDIKDNDGRTPLFEAVRNEKISTVEMLLKRGANANEVSNNGMTPLWAAAYVKYPQGAIFDLLIKFKADPTISHGGRNLVSYLWSQGECNGHADMIQHLELDPAYVKEVNQEERARQAAKRKQEKAAEAAAKEARDALKKAQEVAALKRAKEYEAMDKRAAEALAEWRRTEEIGAAQKKTEATREFPTNNTEASLFTKAYNFVTRPSVLFAASGATIAAVFGVASPLWIFVSVALVVEGAHKIKEKMSERASNRLEKSEEVSESAQNVQNEHTESPHPYFKEGMQPQNDEGDTIYICSSHQAEAEEGINHDVTANADASQRSTMSL